MSAVEMRNEIIAKYGKESFEGGYIQYVFSHHSTAFLEDVYKDLKNK